MQAEGDGDALVNIALWVLSVCSAIPLGSIQPSGHQTPEVRSTVDYVTPGLKAAGGIANL